MTSEARTTLLHLEGYPFPVLFSDGARTRTGHIASRCQRAHRYLKDVLEFDPRFRLLVLSPEDWSEHAAFPQYGMPHYTEDWTIVVGAEPAGFWQGVVRMLDRVLAPEQRVEAEDTYGTVDRRIDVAPFADLLAVHELGHLFHAQVPFAFPRLWLMELFANLCVHAYLAEREPAHVPLWTTLPERLMAFPPEQVRHRSLDNFEWLYVGVGPENYCWYQCRLVVAAGKIYDATGADGLRRLYRTFAAHNGELSDRRLAGLLEEKVHPTAARVMQTWPQQRKDGRDGARRLSAPGAGECRRRSACRPGSS